MNIQRESANNEHVKAVSKLQNLIKEKKKNLRLMERKKN